MHLSRPTTASVLVACAAILLASLPAPAASPAQLRGRVVAGDGVTPRPGIVVTLATPAGEARFSSPPTTERGSFALEDVPPGEYRLWVETPEGVFVAREPVALREGQAVTVSLTLKPRPLSAQEMPGADEDQEEVPSPPPEGLSTTVKWVLAGVVLVGIAAVLSIVNEEEEPASPF